MWNFLIVEKAEIVLFYDKKIFLKSKLYIWEIFLKFDIIYFYFGEGEKLKYIVPLYFTAQLNSS
jgi:hypothetical protein